MKRLLLSILALVLVVAACGADEAGDGDSTSSTTTTTVAPAGDGERILEIRYEGGFAMVESLLSRVPRFTLYDDGRLVYEGPIDAIFPGPMLPNLQMVDIGVDGLARVLQAVEAAGLPDIDLVENNDANQFVADASNTVITYTDENGDHIYNVYALGITDGDAQLTQLSRIVDTLDELAATSPSIGPYPVERMQILVGEAFGSGEPGAVVDPWPLAVDAADVPDLLMDLKCTVIEGAEAQDALVVFENAHQLTFFESGGTEYRLTVRPLLDGEAGCQTG